MASGWAQAAIAIGGSLMSLFGNRGGDGAEENYAYNLALQKQQQNWLEHMSSTAHQREKADLLAAGFNPLMALNNGASTPNGGLNSLGSDISSAKKAEQANKINAVLGLANAATQQQAVSSASNLQNAQAINQLQDAGLKATQNLKEIIETKIRNKDLDNYEKKFTTEIERIMAQTGLYSAQSNQAASATELNSIMGQVGLYNSETNRMNAQSNKIVASATQKEKESIAKFNDERSRGYSLTSPETYMEWGRNMMKEFKGKGINYLRRNK